MVFEGKAVSSEGIIHEVEKFVGSGLRMCELEVIEGTMGHFLGLITLYLRCMAVHHYG